MTVSISESDKNRLIADLSHILATDAMSFVESAEIGVDPKGAGYIRWALFRGTSHALLVRARDGATEVLVGPLDSVGGFSDEGWVWPSMLDETSKSLRNWLEQAGHKIDWFALQRA